MRHTTPHVLIVDDDPLVAGLVREELSERGFACWTVGQASLARSFLDHHPPDVMIADIHMPQSSGLELLAYARQHASRCKVVLITGCSKSQYLSEALTLGAYDYIEKPFQPGELVNVVSRAVNENATRLVLVDRAVTALETSSRVRQASLDVVTALARAVEAKDPYTRRHSEQVAHYAVHFAQAMGVAAPEVESIRVAALLHDIGKIGVPDHILTKSGPLSSEEFEYIRRHPALGSEILASIALFAREARVVRHHHETWDGQGYPDGLAEEESPLASRIIQVADCIDAMLMERTYKQGYPVQKMLDELVRCAGTQFDPKIASVAVAWCQTNPDKLFLPGKPAPAREEAA